MINFDKQIRIHLEFKLILVLGFWMSFISPNVAQVGIGTITPNASLEIAVSNQASPQNTDGVLIPKIDNFPSTSPTANQDGMLVFVTGNGTPTKGFYYWDTALTNWVPFINNTGTGGNTLDQAYDQGGNGLGKTINATHGAVRINGEDGFLVTGTVLTGNTINTEFTGAGTRMFFNPNKASFRAGSVLDLSPFLPSDQWDDTNIGFYSTAFGASTQASGDTSTAFGSITTASGNIATSFGSFTTASGNESTAFGSVTLASGDSATAFGANTTASETGATAFGFFTIASQNFATAFGSQTVASGVGATAFGSESNASGSYATAFGSLAAASGSFSTAFGIQSTATATAATAFGTQASATGNSAAAIGLGVTAPSYSEIAVGVFNTQYTPDSTTSFDSDDRVFVVGNGVGSVARSDALTIYKNGLVYVTDTLSVGTNTATASLSVNGTANKPGGGTWAVFSDKKLKKNISTYKEGLDFILKVNPVSFSYNQKMTSLLGENSDLKEQVFQGVIAQELQKIAPDMVREVQVNSEKFLEVDPNKFTYALINAIKQQQIQIEQLKKEINSLNEVIKKRKK